MLLVVTVSLLGAVGALVPTVFKVMGASTQFFALINVQRQELSSKYSTCTLKIVPSTLALNFPTEDLGKMVIDCDFTVPLIFPCRSKKLIDNLAIFH